MATDNATIATPGNSFDDNLWNVFDWRHAFFILFMITLAMFGDVLFANDGRILSASGLDLYAGELSGLDFAYRELRSGHLMLWNPHVFSGAFVISTVLYPPHFLFLLLSLPLAVNGSIALHVFLAGCFMYLWTSYQRFHPLSCLFASVLFMFSGPYFFHVFAGHLGNLCAMTWAPLIFLSMDGLLERPSLRWSLVGIFAVAMQILTGQFQYVYYTAIAVALYGGVRLLGVKRKIYVAMGLLSIPIGSLLLCAFHLLPVVSLAPEGVRSSGIAAGFAAMFSFPPENLITLLAPFFFGDIQGLPYWGRCYLWEMCLFIGVAGSFMAVYGAGFGEGRRRYAWVFMTIVLMILALGAHTPLFKILYDWLPGFDKFRGTSKFIFFAMLFFILLAACGMERLIRRGISSRVPAIVAVLVSLLLGGAAAWMYYGIAGTALSSSGGLLSYVQATRESYLPAGLFQNADFAAAAGHFSALSLFIAAACCLIVAFLFFYIRSSRRTVYLLVLLTIIEMFVFGKLNRPTFSYDDLLISQFKSFYDTHSGDYRVLSFVNANTAMSTGAQDIWGYGPVAMGRYVQLMAWTQGADPDKATTYLNIRQYHPLFKMLRLRYVINTGEKGMTLHEYQDWMPKISFIPNWRVAGSRQEVFKELANPVFDPRKMVILERAPVPVSADTHVKSDMKNTCEILDKANDYFTMKASLATPAILLITDKYSRGWRVLPLTQGTQKAYEIIPANYTLMAVPLAAGEHELRFEYRPPGFVIGSWISSVSW
ncbi:MAG: YfhO family protein, partial [Syntrophales bacterium]|nr:YfhO family protein [Syntrophales bacterium]